MYIEKPILPFVHRNTLWILEGDKPSENGFVVQPQLRAQEVFCGPDWNDADCRRVWSFRSSIPLRGVGCFTFLPNNPLVSGRESGLQCSTERQRFMHP